MRARVRARVRVRVSLRVEAAVDVGELRGKRLGLGAHLGVVEQEQRAPEEAEEGLHALLHHLVGVRVRVRP